MHCKIVLSNERVRGGESNGSPLFLIGAIVVIAFPLNALNALNAINAINAI